MCFFYLECVRFFKITFVFDVAPLRNGTNFSTSVYFADVIIVFELAILMYLYIRLIDSSHVGYGVKTCSIIFSDIFSLTELISVTLTMILST